MIADRHVPTRRRLLAGGASALAASVLDVPALTTAAQQDRDLLDLLYVQEQALIDHYANMLDAFDDEAFRGAGFSAEIRPKIEEVLEAETIHQAVVARPDHPRLTSPAAVTPNDPVGALRQAAEMENFAVAAYAFVIPELGRQRLIPDLLGILSVEGRHAAWLATLLGEDPFPAAIDAPLNLDESHPAATAAATPSAAASEADVDLAPIVAAIASALDVDPNEVSVVSASSEVWPDAALGCPQPDMLYAQVATPGFRIVTEVAGEEIEFHTDERGNVVRCP